MGKFDLMTFAEIANEERKGMKVLVTGVAGFIGFHVARRLLNEGYQVHGIDNLNDYYDVSLKQARLNHLLPEPEFTFGLLDISDRQAMSELFTKSFDVVIHLAAQAGVRYSLDNPHAYVDSNLVGFINVLEGCRHSQIKHLLFASSSSVYGKNTQVPFREADPVDTPVSLYAATKKANELMAHSYSHLYQLPITGLRFFTVYGPWGRPDMAYYKFAKAIANNQCIDVYNYGKMQRDFTYIDDVVEAIFRLTSLPHQSLVKRSPYKIYNLGNHHPIELGKFIKILESLMGKTAQKRFLPLQPGDVLSTYANVDQLIADINFKPTTTIHQGLELFVNWYQEYLVEPRSEVKDLSESISLAAAS